MSACVCVSLGFLGFTLPVAQLSTRHLCVGVRPTVVTHCAPLTAVEDFQASLVADCTTRQPHSAIWTDRQYTLV